MGWQEMMIHLKRNWPAKILSLLAAIVMWFFIMRDQNPVMEVSYTVPVQVQNLAANYIIEDAPQYVRVTLSGPRDTIINLKSVMAATRVVMKVNVAGQTKNFSAVADLEAWDNAGNVLDVNISPTQGQAQYELNLLRKDKAVPISAITVGQVADGYEVKGITIKPVQVTITGREEMVDSVSDLKTESIDISNATAPIDGTYNIVIPDGLTSKMTTVHVTVDIQRKA